MVQQKNNDRKIRAMFLAIIGISLLLPSCKREDKKNPIEFDVVAHIPYSKEPISGVKYIIREYKPNNKDYLGSKEYTDFAIEGETDGTGKAHIAFFPKKNLKYQYDMSFDYSGLKFENYTGSYSLINPPRDVNVVRNDQMDFEIRALPITTLHFKIRNINCYDESDVMRYRIFNMDEFPYQEFQYIPWSNPFVGCNINLESINLKVIGGREVYQIEVTRNNVVTEYIDTFFLKPNITNEVFIEY